MKILYEFDILREEVATESTPSKNEAGEDITIQKIVKKQVPKTFVLKKPTRTLIDEGDLFYGIKLSEYIKKGLLTRAQFSTKFANEIGTLSEQDKVQNEKLYAELINLELEIQKLNKQVEEKTEADSLKLNDLTAKSNIIKEKLKQFLIYQESFYQYSAEVKARNKVILWWTVNLAVYPDGSSFFAGETFEDKVKRYEEIEESEDRFQRSVIKHFLFLTSYWFMGNASKKEDFDNLKNSADFKAEIETALDAI